MSEMAAPASVQMDRIYRYQRHLYDVTRRNFLAGRDTLVSGLLPPDGGTVVEVGCGTARNLIEVARAYPNVRVFGFDISSVMLETARARIKAAGFASRIQVVQGDAADFDLQAMFGFAEADRIFLSYTLSMIPPWRDALDRASRQLAPGGSLHVVDFGQLERAPRLARSALYSWLARFSVHPSAELEPELRKLAMKNALDPFIAHPFRGYTTYAVLRRK